MEPQTRLDSISPKLSELFRLSENVRRRRALLSACLRAVTDAGLRGQDVDRAIDCIRSGASNFGNLRANLLALAQHLDEQYFALSDDDRPTSPNALPIFQQARAASALAFAISSTSTDWREAIYEAIAASKDKLEMIRLITVELETALE